MSRWKIQPWLEQRNSLIGHISEELYNELWKFMNETALEYETSRPLIGGLGNSLHHAALDRWEAP